MARIRSIHPDACDSEKLGALTADAERLFWRLQTHCDDSGRCEDNPRLIWARCMAMVDGWSAKKVDASLGELHDAELILRYRVNGAGYVQVEQWDRFQHPQRRTPSTFPEPSEADPPNDSGPDGTLADDSMSTRGVVREPSASPRVQLIPGEEGRGGGEGGEGEPSSALVLIATATPHPTAAESVTFDDFWQAYPRKVAKAEAAKAFTRAAKSATPEAILAGLRRHLPALATAERRYVPHASTWLNGRRWEDPAEPDRPLGRNQGVLERLANGDIR